ncbi:MAG: hypothetical protein CM15mP117_15190 [Alphaproteobacteria bacterium]|nr:MAG: hypothetical protein CM15mP117_15190 [Alphaproteobacteria bacterium]
MARIAGINIPTKKRVEIALTYIHGIGLTSSKKICEKAGITAERRVNDLTEDELTRVRDIIDEDFIVEGDLRRKTSMDIKRYLDLGCLRGLRHRRNLPVRGQRTHTNARQEKALQRPSLVKRNRQNREKIMAKQPTQTRVRRREKKNIATGVAHVNSTFNNTMITISDVQGNTIAWSSAGTMGFKGSRKSHHSLHRWQQKMPEKKLLSMV